MVVVYYGPSDAAVKRREWRLSVATDVGRISGSC